MRLPWLALAMIGTSVAACDVGTYTGPNGTLSGTDAPIGAKDAPGTIGACESNSSTRPNGNHNAGQGCLNAGGCHGANPGSTVFTIGGTLYTTAAGTTAAPGATIFIGTQKLIVATNGNFYTTNPVTFPTTTKASLCPDTKPMVGPLNAAGDGNCNTCHNGATTAKLYLK
jgi:hypothetical protein